MNMKALALLVLLLVAGAAQAQQPGVDCAPIQGQGWSGCAPIYPSQQPAQGQQPQIPQPSPQRWQDHWGAIATDIPNKSVGVAANMASRSQAESAAIMDCQSRGGAMCKIEISYSNTCAALVVGINGHNTRTGATSDAAVQAGVKKCSEEGTNCHAYYSACSLPQRIQ
jgi:Domain of unknown function (DUF4189)